MLSTILPKWYNKERILVDSFDVSKPTGSINMNFFGFGKERNKMYIIAGLGNPKPEYMHTRHNVGFDAIDILGDKNGINVETLKLRALTGKGIIAGQKVILVKPQTFMNLSGESIRPLVDYFKVDVKSELIIVYDDIYLEPGNIRIRTKGSAGGHNGMKSIINHLGTDEFMRVRIGVGEKPKGYDLADFVLSHFSQDEKEAVYSGMIKAANAVEMMIASDVDAAMTEYNRKTGKTDPVPDKVKS